MRIFGRRLRHWKGVVTVLVAVLMGTSMTALASHQFTDVPTSAIYHEAVDWLVNRAITLGCATGLFCPETFVTRAQMALFMQRLGGTLTPRILSTVDFGGILDLDSSPASIRCQTDYSPTMPQTALLHGRVEGLGTATGTFIALPMVSTDGGTTWIYTPPGPTLEIRRAQIDTALRGLNIVLGWQDLTQGVAYKFGLALSRYSGTGDLTDWSCWLTIQVVNRNPSMSSSGTLRPR